MVALVVTSLVTLSALAGGMPPYAVDTFDEQEAPLAAEEDPFRWSIESAVVLRGVEDRIELRLAVPPDHTVYRDQVDVSVIESGGLQFGAPDLPPGVVVRDPAADTGEREAYSRDVVVYLPVSSTGDLEAGVPVRLQLRHQGCRPGLCFPPTVVERDVIVAVRGSEDASGETCSSTDDAGAGQDP